MTERCTETLIPPRRFQEGKEGYEWVARHTWQSWRERYKKHAERLDKRIAQIVENKQIMPGEPPVYVGRPDTRPKRPRKKIKVAKADPEDSEDFEARINMTGTTLSPTPDATMNMQPMIMPEMPLPRMEATGPLNLRTPSPTLTQEMPPPVLPTQAPSLQQLAQVRNAVSSANESQDWAIKIGNDPPPQWARTKRKIDEVENDDEDDTKCVNCSIS
jgi:hypothetical protein